MMPFTKQHNFNKFTKQAKSNQGNRVEDSEDEPLPIDYTNKLKSLASLNNQKENKSKMNTQENLQENKVTEKNSENSKKNEEPIILIEYKNFEDKNANIQNNQIDNQKKHFFNAVEFNNDEDIIDLNNHEEKVNNVVSDLIKNKENQLGSTSNRHIRKNSVSSNQYGSYLNKYENKQNTNSNKNLASAKSKNTRNSVTLKENNDIAAEKNKINKNSTSNFSQKNKANTMNHTLNSNISDTKNNINVSSNSGNKHIIGGSQYVKIADKIKELEKNSIFPSNTNRTDSQIRIQGENNTINRYYNNNKILEPAYLKNSPKNFIENNNVIFENNIEENPIQKNFERSGGSGIVAEASLKPRKGDLTPKSLKSNDSNPNDKEKEFTNNNIELDENAEYENMSASENDDYGSVEESLKKNQKIMNSQGMKFSKSSQFKNNSNLEKNNLNDDNEGKLDFKSERNYYNPNIGNFHGNNEIKFNNLDDNFNNENIKTQNKIHISNKIPLEVHKTSDDKTNNFLEYKQQNQNNNLNINKIDNNNYLNENQNNFLDKYKINVMSNNAHPISPTNQTHPQNFNSNNVTQSNVNYTQNNYGNIKTHASKTMLTDSKYIQYDTQLLSYELVKEYGHLKIDKEEDFMRRMLFDIFKRHTKEERLNKLIEKNKVKIDENDRIKTFNRLIEDANRRIEAQDQIEEMKFRLEQNNGNKKKYKDEEWDDIYQERFVRHQKYKDFWIEEKQKEKKQIADLMEQEILNNCKTVKKSREEIDGFVQRMYNEAERRQLKFQKKVNKFKENEINIVDFINKSNNEKELKNSTPTVFETNNRKNQPKYQFQSDMSGNENSEDENNFINKIKDKQNKLSSRSPQARINNNYSNQHNQIKESHHEFDMEEPSIIHNQHNSESDTNKNLNVKPISNKAWESNYKNKGKSGQNSNYVSERISKKSTFGKSTNNSNYGVSLGNTDINNKRFEIDPLENKRNLVQNITKTTNNNSSVREKSSNIKQFKSKTNNPINSYSQQFKNMEEFEHRNFAMEEEYELSNIPNPIKFSQKRNYSKNSHNTISNQNQHGKIGINLKYMPDHVASKLVDDILSSKLSKN